MFAFVSSEWYFTITKIYKKIKKKRNGYIKKRKEKEKQKLNKYKSNKF